jgi:hypothetical protein
LESSDWKQEIYLTLFLSQPYFAPLCPVTWELSNHSHPQVTILSSVLTGSRDYHS